MPTIGRARTRITAESIRSRYHRTEPLFSLPLLVLVLVLVLVLMLLLVAP